MLYGACAVLASVATTPAMADASDFAGPFLGLNASVNGIELDGSTSDSNNQVMNGSAGMFGVAGGGEIGYNIPITGNFFVTVGANINPGDVKISVDAGGAANANNDDVTMEISDLQTFFIQPSFSFSPSSAVYLKYGQTEADIEVTGDVTKITSLDGDTFGIGTISLTSTGIYFKSEAGYTDFENIRLDGLGTYINTTSGANASPKAAYGQVSIGYKF